MPYYDKYREYLYSPWTSDSPHPLLKVKKYEEYAGICHGMSLDWVRRHLHNKAEKTMAPKPKPEEKFGFTKEEKDVLIKRFSRQMFAQSVTEYVNDTKEGAASPSQIKATMQSMGIAIKGNLEAALCVGMALLQKENFKNFQREWSEQFPAQKSSYKALEIVNDTVYTLHWASVVPLGYAKVKNDYVKSFKQAVSDLSPGHAALILMTFKKEGHAIAIYKEKTNEKTCHVLEPNGGWYKFPADQKLLLSFMEDALKEYHAEETIKYINFLPLKRRD